MPAARLTAAHEACLARRGSRFSRVGALAALLSLGGVPHPATAAIAPTSTAGLLGLSALAAALGALAALAGVALAARLRRNREVERVQAQLAAAIDGVWRCDRQGRIIEWTPTPVASAQDSRPVPGRLLWQVLDGGAECPPPLSQALAEGRAFNRLPIVREQRALVLSGAPQGDGFAGTAIDVSALLAEGVGAGGRTELAARNRQLELTARELDSFAHSVSHDLRAPLRVVDGFAAILLEDYADTRRPLDDLGREHVRRIIAAGSRMNSMIDTLLSMSRMTAAELTRERVNLTQLAQELADELRASDRSRRVQFAIAESLAADGDRTLLRLVLQNLLGNAFKFSAKASPARIEFGVERSGARPVYYVRDNGAGFDMRFADKMFGLFQRFHSANEFPGTGVGLATVQRIIRKHEGRIWAESKPGEGATFFFTLWDNGAKT